MVGDEQRVTVRCRVLGDLRPIHAYRAYRTRTHHLSLEGGASIVASAEFTAERAAVTAI
jgi:hypothetical protein